MQWIVDNVSTAGRNHVKTRDGSTSRLPSPTSATYSPDT